MGKKKKKKKKKGREDFSPQALERSMSAGVRSYGKKLGRWWLEKAGDSHHRKAYRRVARWLEKELPRNPRSIVDYACGAGHLTVELRSAFPRARITCYDGAKKLLARVRRRLPDDRRLELTEKFLPDLDDLHPRVDLTVFCFPHLLPPEDPGMVRAYAKAHPREAKAARKVSKAMRKEGIWDTDVDLDWHTENTLCERMAARHMWLLTQPAGHCARVGYSQTAFEEIDPVYVDYLRFTEGFATSVRGVRIRRFFRMVSDAYVESEVISDVMDQEGPADDDGGGYMICLFEVDR
jgi:hypothetical protein